MSYRRPKNESRDRRVHDRRPIDLFVNRFLNGYPYMCRATDISPAGMRLLPLIEPHEPPRFMGLQFQLPGIDEVITASGEAVFVGDDDGAVGIRFTRLPSASAQAIDRFVSVARAR